MVSINLFVGDSREALEFYRCVFGASVLQRDFDLQQGYRSARFKIDGTEFVVRDKSLDSQLLATATNCLPICMQLMVEDVLCWRQSAGNCIPELVSGVGKLVDKILQAGGDLCHPSSIESPIHIGNDGLSFCRVYDPYGFLWSISSFSKVQRDISLDRAV